MGLYFIRHSFKKTKTNNKNNFKILPDKFMKKSENFEKPNKIVVQPEGKLTGGIAFSQVVL